MATNAVQHLALAQEAADADRPDLVHRHVQAGLAVVTDEETELRLRLTDTGWTIEHGGPGAAREELSALAERAACYPDVVELCRAQRAFTYLRAGELTTAATCLDAVDETLLAPLDRIRVLLNRGTLAAHLQPGTGREDLQAALEVAQTEGQWESAFRALHNLGWSAFLRGDLPAALNLMRRADELEVDVDRTVAQLDLARVQLEAGLILEARGSLTAAAQGAIRAGQQHTTGEIDLELSRIHLLLGEREPAVQACRRARVTFEELGAAAWASRARLREITAAGAQDWRLAGPDPGALIGELKALAATAREQGDNAAWVTGTVAQARLELTLDRLEAVDATLTALGPAGAGEAAYLTTRLAVLDLKTRLALARGERRHAVRTLGHAAQELAEARARPASLDLRTAVSAHTRELAGLDLELAAATRRPWSLLGASERWRPGGDELPGVLPPRDQETAELTETLRAVHEEVRLAPPGVDTRAMVTKARRLERRVRSLDWSAGGGAAPPDSRRPRHQRVQVSRVAKVLAEHHRGLVSYIPVGPTLRAIIVAPGAGAVAVDLGEMRLLKELTARVRADITALATTRAPGPLFSTVQHALLADLEDLARIIVTPVLERLPPEAALVVVPTSQLGNVPWGMLPGTRGRPLVVARSATAWAGGQSNQSAASDVGALAGPGLTYASHEIDALTQIYPAAVQSVAAEDSSAAALARLLATCSTVHVAAHGVHDHDNPLFSYVRTAEGPAFAHEFLHDRVAARHVVIAACEGGRASFTPGEEPLGFAATLLSRGVTTVVAPTSVVPDEDAHTLVVSHHRLLADGVDPITALATATQQAPLLAGSFTAFGSG